MTLLGTVFQPLGISHQKDRVLTPAKDGAESAFMPTIAPSDPPQPDKREKKQILGNAKQEKVDLLGVYRPRRRRMYVDG
jgi:hypothetical protein